MMVGIAGIVQPNAVAVEARASGRVGFGVAGTFAAPV